MKYLKFGKEIQPLMWNVKTYLFDVQYKELLLTLDYIRCRFRNMKIVNFVVNQKPIRMHSCYVKEYTSF